MSEDNDRIVHEYIESKYDDTGRPVVTRKFQVIHPCAGKNGCEICKFDFPAISAR